MACDQFDDKKASSQVDSILASKKRTYDEISGGPVAEEPVHKLFKQEDGSMVSSEKLSKKSVEQVIVEIAKDTSELVSTVEVAVADAVVEAVMIAVEMPTPVMEEIIVAAVHEETSNVTCKSSEEIHVVVTAPKNTEHAKE